MCREKKDKKTKDKKPSKWKKFWSNAWLKFKKKDWYEKTLLIVLFLLIVVCVLMLFKYCETFGLTLSDVQDDWGAFGDYFGSITGLLAFIGVLYSINVTRMQVKESEDKESFFSMMQMYQRQVDSFEYLEEKGIKGFNGILKELESKLIMFIIYKDISRVTNFNLSGIDYIEEIQLKIADSLGIKVNDVRPNNFKRRTANLLKENINIKLKSNTIIIPIEFELDIAYYMSYVSMIIKNNNWDSSITTHFYTLMRESANSIYMEYNHILGQYYRTVFYFLDIISKFKDSELYSKLFRSQLSRYELALLLYNSLSKESNKKVVNIYKYYDIFNNIVIDDIFFLKNLNMYKIKYVQNPMIEESEIDKLMKLTTLNKPITNNDCTLFINLLFGEFIQDPSNLD